MIVTAPQPLPAVTGQPAVFLAGSIEMGTAAPWQQQAIAALEAHYVLFNPRRPDWDTSWQQDATDARFAEQVNWELEALEAADLIILYLDPATKSPVSLLELGLHAQSGKLRVCCPEGFWRKGNVDIVCARYGVPLFNNLDTLLQFIIQNQ